MRWFKHMANAREDESMSALIDKFGHAGYGLYWMILEVVAGKMERGSDSCSVTYPVSKWRRLLGVYHQSSLNLLLIWLQSHGNLSFMLEESGDNLLTISIPKLLKYRDEYSKKSGQSKESVGRKSSLRIQNTDIQNTDIQKEKEKKTRILDHVLLTASEYQKLIDRLGAEKTDEYIERLNNYIGSKGKKYKSHYHTILNWADSDLKSNKKPSALAWERRNGEGGGLSASNRQPAENEQDYSARRTIIEV